MALKKYKPVTPSSRELSVVVDESLTKGVKPIRRLLRSQSSKAGRNNAGRITTRHQGGGVKQKYRLVDFKREKLDIPAKVEAFVYDPNRTCNLAQLCYADGERRYILAPLGLNVGDVIIASESADIKVGNTKKLENIPVGTLVHNIEINPGAGGQMARSAGSFAQVMAKEKDYCLLRLPSGELRNVKINCKATVGQIGNIDHEKINFGKAGRMRKLGVRPSVRGVAMNLIDHPLGGGEGRTSGGRHPVTPWGMPTRGYKTRKNKRTDRFIVKRRK